MSNQLKSPQITLDGTKTIHDNRRPLKNGPSFDLILKNIVDVCDVIRVNIRCNVDRSNADVSHELIDSLSEYKLSKKVSVNFAPVHQIRNRACLIKPDCKGVYSFKTFAALQHRLHCYAFSKSFGRYELPIQKSNACTADRINGIVVEPNGKLIKCWEFIDDETQVIGTLEKGISLNKTALRWLNYNPFDYPLCKSCKILPLCMGWCPARVMAMQNEGACMTTRFNIIRQLMYIYEKTIKNEGKKGGEK